MTYLLMTGIRAGLHWCLKVLGKVKGQEVYGSRRQVNLMTNRKASWNTDSQTHLDKCLPINSATSDFPLQTHANRPLSWCDHLDFTLIKNIVNHCVSYLTISIRASVGINQDFHLKKTSGSSNSKVYRPLVKQVRTKKHCWAYSSTS